MEEEEELDDGEEEAQETLRQGFLKLAQIGMQVCGAETQQCLYIFRLKLYAL